MWILTDQPELWRYYTLDDPSMNNIQVAKLLGVEGGNGRNGFLITDFHHKGLLVGIRLSSLIIAILPYWESVLNLASALEPVRVGDHIV